MTMSRSTQSLIDKSSRSGVGPLDLEPELTFCLCSRRTSGPKSCALHTLQSLCTSFRTKLKNVTEDARISFKDKVNAR